MIDIEAHKNFAVSKSQENKTFLNQLKKKKPKDLDTLYLDVRSMCLGATSS